MLKSLFILFFANCFSFYAQADLSPHKILICGVCKNIESCVPNLKSNAEVLGKHFQDYRVIIYENNSSDQTTALLSEWASLNKKVHFLHETLPPSDRPLSRTEKIANARNKVLDFVRKMNHSDYKYLVMVDLDFHTNWPIEEILKTINSPVGWDCVSSNGINPNGKYFDTYPYRSVDHPFGTELLGNQWWAEMGAHEFSLSGENWIPAYSAFGGLAIYKTSSIIKSSYSGIVTEDLKNYYKKLFALTPNNNPDRQKYLSLNELPLDTNINSVPITFRKNIEYESPPNYDQITCCEHVTLHATMAINGFNKFYINPKMMIKRW